MVQSSEARVGWQAPSRRISTPTGGARVSEPSSDEVVGGQTDSFRQIIDNIWLRPPGNRPIGRSLDAGRPRPQKKKIFNQLK